MHPAWTLAAMAIKIIFFLFASIGRAEAARNHDADMILKNGVIYTADQFDTIVEAAAVCEGKIIYTGNNEGAMKYAGPGTAIIELNGNMAVPGFWDTHVHAPGAKLAELYQINLYKSKNLEDTLKIIRQYIESNPEKDRYFGEGLSLDSFSNDEIMRGPRKERLDEICKTKPVIITFNDLHGCWMNSKAFEAHKITSRTQPLSGGVIEIDPVTGQLWGTLKERAMELVKFEEFTDEQKISAIKEFQKMMLGYGYVGILAINAPFDCFSRMRDRGELKMYVSGSTVFNPEKNISDQFDELKKIREKYSGGLIKADTIKIFVDGVVEHGTAYLKAPYLEGGKGPDKRGIFLWDMDLLIKTFIRAGEEGFQLHVHSIGDAATKNVLDALEKAKARTGGGERRHTITHLQLVSNDDYARFKRLGVIANVQPYWAFKMPFIWESIELPKLGERANNQQPIGSFFNAGVTLAASSDYPITIEPDPMRAIKIGVTRDIDNPEYYGISKNEKIRAEKYSLDKKERASVAQMIKAFTINGAYSTFKENVTGSLEIGKDADFVILNNDLFKIEPALIDTLKVQKTIFKGKIVYDSRDDSK